MQAARPRLCGQVVPPHALSAADVERLFLLYAAHYDAVDRSRFLADLAEKDDVILLRDAGTGALRGFSTQKLLRVLADGRPARALFSGDTIIDPSCWGEQELVRAWGRYAGRLLAAEDTPLWWLLISKGHRTYLYLPLFFREYWPRREAATPPAERELLDAFASAKFGQAWDPGLGVLRFSRSQGQLRTALAEVPPGRREDPRVRFFLERNPGYAAGDELVCLAQIAPDNMRSVAGRAVVEGLAAGRPREAEACSIS